MVELLAESADGPHGDLATGIGGDADLELSDLAAPLRVLPDAEPEQPNPLTIRVAVGFVAGDPPVGGRQLPGAGPQELGGDRPRLPEP